MQDDKLKKYKTVMCQRVVRTGGCRYGLHCFGDDTRVLTDRGFLFRDQIEALVDKQGLGLAYACYDVAQKAIVYTPGAFKRFPNTAGHLLSFTSADETRQWQPGGSADYGTEGDAHGNHLSMRVTPDHVMYLQLQNKAGAHSEPQKVLAGTLRSSTSAHIQFIAAAVSGTVPSDPFIAEELRWHLGMDTPQEVDTFLAQFGFELADCSLGFSHEESHLPWWVLHCLDRRQARLVVDGLRRAKPRDIEQPDGASRVLPRAAR